jgi:hypothetical protein
LSTRPSELKMTICAGFVSSTIEGRPKITHIAALDFDVEALGILAGRIAAVRPDLEGVVEGVLLLFGPEDKLATADDAVRGIYRPYLGSLKAYARAAAVAKIRHPELVAA